MTSEQFAAHELVIAQQPTVQYSSGFPPTQETGLEGLIHLDKVFIHQKIKVFALFRGPNKYIAVDQNGRPLYDIREDPHDLCGRLCYGGNERSFVISFIDAAGYEAVRLEKTLMCMKSECSVYNGHRLLGIIKRSIWSCSPQFRIVDDSGQLLYKIVGHVCVGGCSPEFGVYEPNGNEIGLIKKHWAGFLREITTDIFGVSFPVNVGVHHKALLLGAAIVIDFTFFEGE